MYHTKHSFVAIDDRYTEVEQLLIENADKLLPESLCIIPTALVKDVDGQQDALEDITSQLYEANRRLALCGRFIKEKDLEAAFERFQRRELFKVHDAKTNEPTV